MKKERFYSVHGECTDSVGNKHVVTIVGKLEKFTERKQVADTIDFPDVKNVTVVFKDKQKKKKLTLGMSICHPWDTFDLEIGEKLAKSHIKHGKMVSSLETFDMDMLTMDEVMAILNTKLTFILGHIERYIPAEKLNIPAQEPQEEQQVPQEEPDETTTWDGDEDELDLPKTGWTDVL